MFTLEYLESARLGDLAAAALAPASGIAGRLSCFEALRARLGELAGGGWLDCSAAERLAISRAANLDLSAAGFIEPSA